MDKNIIKKHLNQKFVNEAKGETATPGITVTNAAKKQSEKFNKEGVKDIDKNLSSYEGSLKKGMETTKVPNKFNYNGKSEEEYHAQMETMNGQEMLEYDREPNKEFKDRAKQALEGSSIMGNKGGKEMGNAEETWGSSSNEFGKNLAKNAKASFKKRQDAETGIMSFGDDIEIVPKGTQPMGKHSALAENKDNNKPKIKQSMKRLNFKKEFNGVGNALKMIPESYKVDNKVFEMTDGVENYKIRWEGNLNEGKAVVLMASDKTMVNEDMAHMKHLMGYKSQETLGTVKGKARLDENKMFTDIWAKTRELMEAEDIENAKAKTGNLEDIKKKAPEATKHVQGSVSKDKGTKAPAAKEGDLDDAVSHAPEAKKHVEGSVSTEKGTKAPAPKKGEWEGVKKKASEATKHITMKESFQSEEDAEVEDAENEENVTTENVETSKAKGVKKGNWDEINVPHAAEAKKHVHMGKAGMTEGIQLGENFFAPMSENLYEYGDEHEMSTDDAVKKMGLDEYGDEHEISTDDAVNKMNLDEYGDEHEISTDDAVNKMELDEYGDEHEISTDDALKKKSSGEIETAIQNAVPKIINDPLIQNISDKIMNDPKAIDALKQFMNMGNVQEDEDMGVKIPDMAFLKNAIHYGVEQSKSLTEGDQGGNIGAFLGMFAGGAYLADKYFPNPQVVDKLTDYVRIGGEAIKVTFDSAPHLLHDPMLVQGLGGLAAAILGCIAYNVFKKLGNK